jgi:glycosyltransferase involved in cell wall biosynthesis
MAQNGNARRNLASVQCLRQANAGPSAARNRGFRAATGEFIQFLDSDDILEPAKLAIQVEQLRRRPDVDFCVCDFVRVNPDNTAILERITKSVIPHGIEEFPAVYPMSTDAPLYRREIVIRVGGYDESLRAGEDFEFNFRIALEGKGIWIGDYLVRRRVHQSEERIQAGNCSRWFDSLSLGLVKMELAAARRGLDSPRLRKSLARRALAYERALRREAEHDKADFFRRYALSAAGLPCWLALRLSEEARNWRKRRRNRASREAMESSAC